MQEPTTTFAFHDPQGLQDFEWDLKAIAEFHAFEYERSVDGSLMILVDWFDYQVFKDELDNLASKTNAIVWSSV